MFRGPGCEAAGGAGRRIAESSRVNVIQAAKIVVRLTSGCLQQQVSRLREPDRVVRHQLYPVVCVRLQVAHLVRGRDLDVFLDAGTLQLRPHAVDLGTLGETKYEA